MCSLTISANRSKERRMSMGSTQKNTRTEAGKFNISESALNDRWVSRFQDNQKLFVLQYLLSA
jgi:hypothetical protein